MQFTGQLSMASWIFSSGAPARIIDLGNTVLLHPEDLWCRVHAEFAADADILVNVRFLCHGTYPLPFGCEHSLVVSVRELTERFMVKVYGILRQVHPAPEVFREVFRHLGFFSFL